VENELEKIIYKYFKDDKVKYYHPWDAIFDDQYLRWEYNQHKRDEIVISCGSDDGEVRVKVFTDAIELETFIKIILS
jgi:hypothetical protein